MTAFAIAPSATRYSDLVAQVSTAAKQGPTTAPAVLRSLIPLPADLVPGTVYETTEYAMFHHLLENREVDQKHVRKLVREISKKNLLHLKPIDVTTTGGVVDGQHRLEAARELGLPVFYRVTEELGEAEIASLNVAQKNWTGPDYLHYWTAKGRPAYRLLSDFMQHYPQISFSNAKLMMGLNDTSSSAEFQAGNFQTGDPKKGEQTAALILRISQEARFKYAVDSRFVGALHHCVAKLEGFNADRFVQKIMLQPAALMRQATHKQYLEMFADIYNYKTTEAYKLRFF